MIIVEDVVRSAVEMYCIIQRGVTFNNARVNDRSMKIFLPNCYESAIRTMHLCQRRSYRSSSCPRSSPQGCRSTAEPQAGSLPSSSASLLPGPATRTWDCHLQQCTTQSVTTGTALMPAGATAQAQVGQGRGLYLEDCIGVSHKESALKEENERFID